VKLNAKRICVYIAFTVITATVLFAFYAVPKLIDGIDDACAQSRAADMVIDYMRDHNGEWPPDWKAIEPYFAESNGRVGGWTFDRFTSHVHIDFGADENDLRAASVHSDSVPFDVIHATCVWGSQFEGGPNEIHGRFLDRESVAGRDGFWRRQSRVPLSELATHIATGRAEQYSDATHSEIYELRLNLISTPPKISGSSTIRRCSPSSPAHKACCLQKRRKNWLPIVDVAVGSAIALFSLERKD